MFRLFGFRLGVTFWAGKIQIACGMSSGPMSRY
jgi:hypothetical protein